MNRINTHGEVVVEKITKERYETAAEALAMILQQLSLSHSQYMPGVLSYQNSIIQDIIYKNYAVDSDVKIALIKWKKKNVSKNLNDLIDHFRADYACNYEDKNLFTNLEGRFLTPDELVINKHIISGYN